MIELRNVCISFDEEILKKTSIKIPEQKITLIRGVSGSGKTSLLYRIGCVSDDHAFSYYYGNQNLTDCTDRQRSQFRRCTLSYVLQDNSLFDQYDVLGNLKLYSSFHQRIYSNDEYRTILQSVNLSVPLNQSIDTLSGGERQRLAIACCLCKDTEVILLDEPTSFLDEENENNVFRVLRNIADQYKKTIIITSHSEQACSIADQIYEISNNELHEIKHSVETDSIGKKGIEDEAALNIGFFMKYLQYFMSKYKKSELQIILILSTIMCVISCLMIFTEKKTQESARGFEKLSENQMFITASPEYLFANNLRQGFFLDTEAGEIYPYIDTKMIVNGFSYPVLPFFPKRNHFSDFMFEYSGTDIFISYDCYLELQGLQADLEKDQVKFAVEVNGNYAETIENYHIAGVLNRNEFTRYLDRSESKFVYVSYELLDAIYKKYANTKEQEYKGYTVFTDSFEEYKELSKQLAYENYGVNLFFDHMDELSQLLESGRMNMIYIITCGCIFASIILMFIENTYIGKREKELMMLKINGAENKHIFSVVYADIIIHTSIAFMAGALVLVLGGQAIVFSVLKDIGFLFLCTLGINTAVAIYSKRNIDHMSMENVMRGS